MRAIRILPLLPLVAMLPLLGCDGAGDWLRGPAAASASAAPLASDTTVVTTRRMLSFPPGSNRSLGFGSPMPDGAGIAVTDWMTGDLAVFDPSSEELSRFRLNDTPFESGVAIAPVTSPDGSQIAFFWQDWTGQHDGSEVFLRVVDVATAESRTLLAPDTAVAHYLKLIAWTPAGDSVFAALSSHIDSDIEVVLVPADGGTPRQVHTAPTGAGRGHIGLSPDGRWLVYNREISRARQSRSDIYIIDVQSGRERPLVEHPAVDQLIGWLPGTDVLLFSSDRSGTTDLWSVRVANGRTTGEPRMVRSGFHRSQAVGFGNGALFYTVETGASGPAVVSLDPESGAPLGAPSPPLAALHTYYPVLAWSPDGETLAAPTHERGRRSITVHSMTTGVSQVFWADEGASPLAVEWAADGQALFVRAGGAGPFPTGPGPQYFLRLDLITGTTQRLFATTDPEEQALLWRFRVTPDGRSLVLRQRHTLADGQTGIRLVLRSLQDGSERELHSTSGHVPEFSLSADGTQLAFTRIARDAPDSLFVLAMDASQPLRAVATWETDEITLLGWLPNGTTLLGARLTEDASGEELVRIGLDGSVSLVGMSPFPPQRGQRVPGYYRSRLTLSPAGNRLTHLVSDAGQELWRMDGLHELFANEANGGR